MSDEVHFWTIARVAAALRKREISPVELTRALLERIQALDGKVSSFITVTEDLALAQAKDAEAALLKDQGVGPLTGVPIALKDLYATKGIRTTAHSKVLVDWLPNADATTTSLLQKAGTVLLGKLAMHEYAFGAPGFDTPFPPARNPWDLERVTGGSSSGSGAALAAGFCYGALGSDTGGSIRGPSMLCGVAGIKPTYGRVSRSGVVPLSWSLDHAGPMARSVEDCALLLQAIAGHDATDPASANVAVPDYTASLGKGVQGLRIGVPRAWFDEGDGTEPAVMAAFEAAAGVLKSLGATMIEVDAAPFIAARGPNTIIMIAEAYSFHEQTLRTRPHDLSRGVQDRAREGAFISAADYIDSMRARTVISRQVKQILDSVDVIVSPAMARTAARFDEPPDPEARYRQPAYTPPFNLTGLPAMSVPCGFSSEGLPVGLQIAGRAFDEATVLQVAHAYEGATGWHTRHPAL